VTTPKAFICHASEDKERFVLGFARKLREKGIDAWLDQWEIKPGDSLVNKIFEEGIKNADAFIVVLSTISVSKKWVKEELNTGIVNRIDASCRLIPIIIDSCEVPEALKHVAWVRISDLNNYEDELSRIVNAIYGLTDKPPLGSPPPYTATSLIDYLPELTRSDNLVWKTLCNMYITTGDISISGFREEMSSLGLSDEETLECLEVLHRRGHIKKLKKTLGGEIVAVGLNVLSVDDFLRHEVPDYEEKMTAIISKIVNEDLWTNMELQQQLSIPLPIVNHVLEVLELRGLVELVKTLGGMRQVYHISPELRRILRQQGG